MNARTVTLDIETSPNLADVWGLWNVNVGLSQLRATSEVMGVGYKWLGEPKVYFPSDYHTGHEAMLKEIWGVLDEADCVITYNGDSFDLKHLRRAFLLADMNPPSPVKSIDLLKIVRKNFRFSSNKLDHVAQQLGIGKKVSHSGHELWTKCMAGDERAWQKMRIYCMGDVRLTEKLYTKVEPWASSLPHQGLFSPNDELACPRCGSTRLQRRGQKAVQFQVYPQYQCQKCKGWLRGTEILDRAGGTRAL